MFKRAFTMAVASDIHLNNRRTHTQVIVNNLDRYLTNSNVLKDIDILFLAGDVTDELMDMSCDEGHITEAWMANTILLCAKNNVTLRVLEGTPSHDRLQSQRFITVNEILNKAGVDTPNIKYVKELSIEYIEEFGINVLYVPDKWGSGAQDTLDQVHKLMREKGIEKVDFAIMHGAFEHQLPFTDSSTHNAQAYLDITNCLIFIGHVHVRSEYERILAQGSFDRICHGEESPKGFYKASIEQDGTYTTYFVENKTAAIYKTIQIPDIDVVESILQIEHELKGVSEGSAIRIQAHWNNPIFANVSLLKERWPYYVWTMQPKDMEKKTTSMLIDHKKVYIPLQINRQNITQIVSERLKRFSHSDEAILRCRVILESAIADIRTTI
jgi:hypothetical protein